MTDPVFVQACAISEALTEITIARDHLVFACGGENVHREDAKLVQARLEEAQRRLRAAQEIGLDIQVTTSPLEGQEVLFNG